MQNYNAAEKALLEALRRDPDWDEAHHALGLVLIESGKKEEALKQLAELHRLRSKLSEDLQKNIDQKSKSG